MMDPEKDKSLAGVHLFTYKELGEATNNFDSNKELGDGGFGAVYYGKRKIQNLTFESLDCRCSIILIHLP